MSPPTSLLAKVAPTRYDLLLAIRTLLVGGLLALIVLLIGITTDERGSSWPGRLARLSALLPVAGAVAGALVLAQARSRGEALALAALGMRPLAIVRGALLGSVLVGLVGAVAVAIGVADVASLFPRIEPGSAWLLVDGSWVDSSRGLLVSRSGELGQAPIIADPGSVEAHRGLVPATALALFFASWAVPTWLMTPSSPARRLAVALALGMTAVASFHLVGAERVSPLALTLAPLLLLFDAILRGRVSSRATSSPP